MSDKRQIHVTYPNGQKIYFYTHNGGYTLPRVVAEALNTARDHWSDPSYLARVVFNQMTADDPTGITGYGIATEYEDSDYANDDIHLHLSFGGNGRVGIGEANMTYKDFIREYLEEEDV